MSFHCHVCSHKRIEAYTTKAKTNAKVFPGIASLESTKTNHRHVLPAKVKFSAILAHCNLLQHPGSFFVGASIARLNGHKEGSFFLPWLFKALHTYPGSQPQFTKWWFLLVKLLEPPGPKNVAGWTSSCCWNLPKTYKVEVNGSNDFPFHFWGLTVPSWFSGEFFIQLSWKSLITCNHLFWPISAWFPV